jgi:hypothetical protein
VSDNVTHGKVGGAGAAVVCAALAVPIVWWAIPIATAAVASPWPDRLERVPRALWRQLRDTRWADGRVDRRLRRLQVHRYWTHWLTTGLTIALVLGAGAFGALIGTSALLLMALEGVAPDRAVTMPAEVWTYAAWMGVFVALGVFVGYALHSYLDGWTELGSPIGGVPGLPRTQRRRHVIPKWIVRRRARRGREPWINEADEARLRRWSPRVIVASAAAHFHAVLWPLVVQAFEAGRAALT